jgi:hypothetical protein
VGIHSIELEWIKNVVLVKVTRCGRRKTGAVILSAVGHVSKKIGTARVAHSIQKCLRISLKCVHCGLVVGYFRTRKGLVLIGTKADN